MQVLYVVDFTVKPRSAEGDSYQAALHSVASWLGFLAGRPADGRLLAASGRMMLKPSAAGIPRAATWEPVGTDNPKAVRIEVRDEKDSPGTTFVTHVTIGLVADETSVRVSMAQEGSPIGLSPAPPADVHQPGVVRSLLENNEIVLTIAGQRQDGRYLQVRTDAEVGTLADAIRGPIRLPILLIHSRTLPALSAAWTVASRLTGMVRAVTLDYRACQALEAELPGFAPPYAGGRLIWSDPAAPTVVVESERVNAEDPDTLRAHLMGLLAPISVLARGVDRAYRQARRAEIAHRDHDAHARTQQAVTEGDLRGQVTALSAELSTARANAEEWQQLTADEEQRADQFQAQAERVPALQAQVEQLKIALMAAPATQEYNEPQADPWAALPELVTSDTNSAMNLFLHLEDAASGHIEFTERAAPSWKKSKYPYPDEMADCLVKLARVAAALYDGSAHSSIPHLDTWIREEFNLKVALQDDKIEKDAKLRYFDHEGVPRDRTPHVKVRDYAPPSQVGRIHFALDHEGQRLIVDHVGLKLY